jgi:hypothetical protein
MRTVLPVCLLLALTSHLPAAPRDLPYCSWLDRADEPAWDIQAGWLGSAAVQGPGGRSYSALEVRGGGGLWYGEAPGGEAEVDGSYAVWMFEGQGGVDLPDALADAHVRAGYVWRHWDGRSLRVRIQPGFYGEVSAWDQADALRVPFEIVGLQTLSPRWSGQLGVAVYPGFARSFDPRFGVRGELSETWSVDLNYPESRLVWRSAGGTEAYLRLRNDPIQQFWLEEDDARRFVRFEETRLVAGWSGPSDTVVRLRVEAGYVFNRSVEAGRGSANRAVEDTWVVSIGLGGAL